MKSLRLIPVLLCLAALPTGLMAQSPPPDSVIAWFNNVCYRPNQAKAFFTIIKSRAGFSTGYFELIEVKEEYDLPGVKAAFETFVRSITIEWPDCPGGYVPSGVFKDFEPVGEAEKMPNIDPMVFSVCVSWGIEEDFYEMIDKFSFFDDLYYSMYVLDKVGTGYFEYAKAKAAVDSTYLRGHGIASSYFNYFKSPSPEMVEAALDVIEAFANSPYELHRKLAVHTLVDAYNAGYEQVKPLILQLKEDSSSEVRRIWRYVISNNHEFNKLLEFEIDFDEPGE